MSGPPAAAIAAAMAVSAMGRNADGDISDAGWLIVGLLALVFVLLSLAVFWLYRLEKRGNRDDR